MIPRALKSQSFPVGEHPLLLKHAHKASKPSADHTKSCIPWEVNPLKRGPDGSFSSVHNILGLWYKGQFPLPSISYPAHAAH